MFLSKIEIFRDKNKIWSVFFNLMCSFFETLYKTRIFVEEKK